MRRSTARTLATATIPLIVAPLLGSCSTKAPTETSVMSGVGHVDLPARRIRVAADDAAAAHMRTVELAADSIIEATVDRDVALAALAWKAHALPALQTTMHHPDPLVSYVDGWVLMEIMQDYFETGRGRAAFGDQQTIAIEAMRGATERLDASVGEALGDTLDHAYWRDAVRRWAAEHPLDNDLFLHRSISTRAADLLGAEEMGGFRALGSMHELAADATQMMRSFMYTAPRTTLWQAELAMASMLDSTRIELLLAPVDELEITRAATGLMEDAPDLVRREREIVLAEVERLVSASTDRALAAIREERMAAMRDVAALAAREREAVFREVERRLPGLMDRGRSEAIAVLDHVLLRLGAGLLVVLALGTVAWWILSGSRRGVEAGRGVGWHA